MTLSLWQQEHRDRANAYDIIIVGGGVLGCSTAYWLHRLAPSLEVGIIEARSLGAGASGRNAGFVIEGTSANFLRDVERYGERTARRLWNFTRTNRNLLASELRSSAFEWQSKGSLTVAGDAEEDERLQASVAHLRAAGAPVTYLDPEQTNERLRSTGFYGGLYITTGAVINPLQLVQTLATASTANLHTHLPVKDVEWDADGGVVLQTPDLRFWAKRVVLAVGPWLPELVPSLASVVRPVRAQMLATSAAETRSTPLPVYSHRGGFYLRQLNDGVVLAGGGRHGHRAAEETASDATTPAVQAAIERYLHTHFPWTQSLSIRQRWSGTMGFSPDGRPVVGEVPDHPESVFATGFTGHGLGYGFRMGRLLATRIIESRWPTAYDLFSVSRFDDAGVSPMEDSHSQDAAGDE